MLNSINRTFTLIIEKLHLVNFQNVFTYVSLAQSPNNPMIRLGGTIQDHSTDWKIEALRGYILFKFNMLK